MSDGIRYVAYATVAGPEMIVDGKTGLPRVVATPPCTGTDGQPDGHDEVIGLSDGKLILTCPATRSLRVMDVATRAVQDEIGYTPTSNVTTAASTAGTRWARFPSCQYGGSGNVSCEAEELFSVTSGAPYPGKVHPGTRSFADLDSATLVRSLCTPVRLAHARLEGEGAYERVEAFEAPWVLLRRGNLATPPHLLAWKCGRPRAVDLGTLSDRPQLGAGIATWQDTRGVIHAERLGMGTSRTVKAHHAEYVIVHTATRVYVAERHSAVSVDSAPLGGIGVGNYTGPTPAVVAPPEGIATRGP